LSANAESKETFGAVRMSVGLANTVADVERGLDVIASLARGRTASAVRA
jgi:selenocysteine lyase/cysteine desulfurase